MVLTPSSQLREVTGVCDDDRVAIRHFLQGAVYCWCKNRPHEWFSLRDLMGGENYHWEGTPMIALYRKHEANSPDPVKSAGKDGGWLLKSVIDDDSRTFETREANLIREYRWVNRDA